MPTPFPFSPGNVLTAAQLNAITNLPSSTKTTSYTFVAADASTRVVMNAAGSTTLTVNTSIFSAGDVVEISNIGTGVTTVTAGTATVSSAGPLAVPQYGGGRLVFTSASAAIYFPSAVTAAAASSGLTFITSGTQAATATAGILNIFSSSYTSYKIILRNMSSSVANQDLRMRLGSAGSADTGSNYNNNFAFFTSSTQFAQNSSVDKWSNQPNFTANSLNFLDLQITAPNLATTSFFNSQGFTNQPGSSVAAGMLDTSTQYTDLFLFLSSGNIGFSYQVFGYANS